MNAELELQRWLALSQINGLGAKTLQRLFSIFPQNSEISSCEAIFKASNKQLQACGMTETMLQALRKPNQASIDAALTWRQANHHHLLTLADPAYPKLLKEIASPPLILYIKGQLQALTKPAIAMVGSRNPSPLGSKTAFAFAQDLARSGLAIISGLAIGIDTASHAGTLQAGGTTVAVMGTGLNVMYPKRNQGLAEQIYQQGALVSEFPLDYQPTPQNFPRRNRIISGLCLGTLVVEATLKSGSLITASYACEQGREVYAIPGSIHNPLARGCHALLKQGAKLVETTNDVLEEISALIEQPLLDLNTPEQNNPTNGLDSAHIKLVKCIGFEATAVDSLIEHSGLQASTIATMLINLELKGVIKSVPGGYIRAN